MERVVQGANISYAIPWPNGYPGNPAHLRIKRLKGEVTFAYRDPASTEWVTYYTFADESNVFAKDLYLGFAVSAAINSSENMFQTATFSEIALKKLSGTILMLK